MTTTPNRADTIREAWLAIQAELNHARDSWGWDDPRTLELEEAEAHACDLYLATAQLDA